MIPGDTIQLNQLDLFLLFLALATALFFTLFLRQLHYNRILESKLRSQSVRHGLSVEQLFPFAADYPFDPRNFRFLGNPIDGISFEQDNIVFIEFKTGKSRLSARQKQIKEAILSGSVSWKEIKA